MKHCTALAVSVALALAAPATAENVVQVYAGSCFSGASYDDFTDELQIAYISCYEDSSVTYYNVVLAINPSGPYVVFVDPEREWRVPEDGEEVDLVYRFDDQSAVFLTDSWEEELERVIVNLSIDQAQTFLDALLTADRLIYRIGSSRQDTTHVITLSGDRQAMYDAVAESVKELLAGIER